MESSVDKADLGTPLGLAPKVRRTVSGREYSLRISHDEVQFFDETSGSTHLVSNLIGYLPVLRTQVTRTGMVVKRQPSIIKETIEWWRAQCAFRGLPVTGKLRDLQERLRSTRNNDLSQTLKNIREVMIQEYSRVNEVAVEEAWAQANNNEKAKLWPKRLMYEVFDVQSRSGPEALILDIGNSHYQIWKACSELGIHCEIRQMPSPMLYTYDPLRAIVGYNKEAVQFRTAETDREIKETRERVRQERQEKQAKARHNIEDQFELARSEARRPNTSWNVSGKWKISCPYVEEQWGYDDPDHECSLEIGFTSHTETGQVQMYATFDFIVITGIMRFVNRVADAHAQNQQMEGYETSTPPPQFLLPASSLPSFGSQDFNFRWRGEETGEGEIQADADEDLCSLRFESDGALTGTFISGVTDEITFKGFKVDQGRNGAPEPKSKSAREIATLWNDRSYEDWEDYKTSRHIM